MNWLQFLQEKPVLTLARESLGDEEFVRLLQRIFRTKTPKELRSTLAWHAFEEIGWPEGATYCHQHKADYSLQMLTEKNLSQQIALRLTLQQNH
jgi:predicted nucleotide-binding protein (sugar kinase/HSP70/actin superfamily)